MKKKAVSLLLIFALLIPYAVCPGYAADQDELVGRWETEIDLAPPFVSTIDKTFHAMFADAFGTSDLPIIGDYIDTLPVSVYLAFNSDGTMESGLVNKEKDMEALNEQLEKAIYDYFGSLCEKLILFMVAEELGVQISSEKDLESYLGMSLNEFCLENAGMSLKEMTETMYNESFPAGTDFAAEFNLSEIVSTFHEWDGEYTVENGQILVTSDSNNGLYADVPPYYEISGQSLSLYLSETKALKDMTLDDIRALDETLDVNEIFPTELGMSEEDSLRFVVDLLGLGYDLTYTRA